MRLDYRIDYSDRKTLSIIVERDRSILVRAPRNMTEKEISQAVEDKKIWIYEKTRHPQKYPPEPVKKEFVSGETILYLGRNYRLELIDEDTKEIRFNSCFYISRHQKGNASELIKKWYVSRGREKLVPRIHYFADTIGVTYNELFITDMKYRWASCSPKNNLNFNWRILKAPMSVVDYLIVHELAHLLELSHSAKFWNIVAVQVPDFERPKVWLRNYGYRLEEDFQSLE